MNINLMNNALSLDTFNGKSKDSGVKSVVYAQIECGNKAGQAQAYVGESCNGHCGRYTWLPDPSKKPSTTIGFNTSVKIVRLQGNGVSLTMGRRKALEGVICEVMNDRGHKANLATTKWFSDYSDLIDASELPLLTFWANKFVDSVESELNI